MAVIPLLLSAYGLYLIFGAAKNQDRFMHRRSRFLETLFLGHQPTRSLTFTMGILFFVIGAALAIGTFTARR